MAPSAHHTSEVIDMREIDYANRGGSAQSKLVYCRGCIALCEDPFGELACNEVGVPIEELELCPGQQWMWEKPARKYGEEVSP